MISIAVSRLSNNKKFKKKIPIPLARLLSPNGIVTINRGPLQTLRKHVRQEVQEPTLWILYRERDLLLKVHTFEI